MTQPTITQPPVTGTTDWPAPAWGSPVPPPPPPPAKRKIGRYILGAVALLFIIGILAGDGNKKDTSSSDGMVTTPTTASTPAATTPPTTAPASLSLAAWASRYGAPDSEQIGADLNALQADAEAMDLSSMASSCRTMQRHVATAESHLPTPDGQLTSALRSAYGYYDQAMTVCISGATNMDADDLTQMTSYISLATGSLEEATARMDVLN